MNNLTDHLINDAERFVVDDQNKANWALRKIKEMQKEIDEAEEFVQEETRRNNEWLKSIKSNKQADIDHFTNLLMGYAVTLSKDDPKFKSLNLPSGRFGFRKQQPKWEYDNEKAVESLKRAGLSDFIRVKEEPNKADIKRGFHVTNGQAVNPDTGEIIEGITVTEQEDSFNVVVDK